MVMPTEERKLAAIMFTDMVGYSALAQRDDKVALELLEEHRRLLREIFPPFHGTEIKTIGDAFLVEFGSALEAAQCAIEIQRTLAKRNHDVTSDRRIELKIGIHIGDVVHRNGDVYGDGVNIASRIEALAGAGGICVSTDVERQIRNALEARFEKFGSADLKNIKLPMDLFRIVLPWEQGSKAEPAETSVSGRSFSTSRLIWIGAIVLVAAGGAGWWFTQQSSKQVASSPSVSTPAAAPSTAPTVGQKSIAVLPFENLSGDPNNAYFAEGIQEEILTRLASIADLKVISRASTQHYQNKPRNLREIAKQLGVANVLEGSVQKAADQVRVNVQLINAQTDSHLWADTYDRKLTDIFGVESEIAKRIADSLQAKLTGREEQTLAAKPTNNPEAYDAYLRGLAFEARNGAWIDLLIKAIGFYEQAVQLDPKFALAWARLSRADALLYYRNARSGDNVRDAAKKALENAQKLEPNSAETLLALGCYQRRVLADDGLAKPTFTRVSKMLPGNSEVISFLATIALDDGHWDQSIAYFEKARALDPLNAELLAGTAWTYGVLRQFPMALKLYDQALDISPNDPDVMASKAGIYQAQGNLEQAARCLSQITAQTPGVLESKINQFAFERNYGEAIRLVQARLARLQTEGAMIAAGGFESQTAKATHASLQLYLAMIQLAAGDSTGAKFTAEQARNTLEGVRKTQSDHPAVLLSLAQANALMGEKDSGRQAAQRAIMLFPVAKDALEKAGLQEQLALVQTSLGENSRAISTLAELLHTPYSTGAGRTPITPVLLRLDPIWDPLRSDPAFQKLCEQKQP